MERRGLRTRIANVRRRAIYRRCLAAPSRAIVLRYHSVGDPGSVAPYVDPGLSLPPDRFREHLRALKQHFRVVSLDAVLERLVSGVSGEPLAAITFDDGYRDNHDVALPILLDEDVTATFFVTSRPLEPGRWFWISELRGIVPRLPAAPFHLATGETFAVPPTGADRTPLRRALTRVLSGLPETEREDLMDRLAGLAALPRGAGLADTFLTPVLLRGLAEKGMTVGAHTRSHPHLDRVDPAAMAEEIEGGKADLEAAIGGPVHHFAYPNPGGGGRNEAGVGAALRAAGFRAAVTSRPEPLRFEADPLRLPRLGVYAGEQEQVLFGVLSR